MKPKLHALTSKDDYRPALSYGLLTKQNIVVTNAHVMVAHKCESLFDQDFIDAIPEDKGVLVPAATLKEMNKKGVTYMLKVGDVPEMEFTFKGNSYSHRLEYDGQNNKFPNWEAVLPAAFDEQFVDAVLFNAKMMHIVKQAINPDSEIVKIKSSGPGRAIGVFDPEDTYEGCRSIIMPCMDYDR
jgi:hypothetical protein